MKNRCLEGFYEEHVIVKETLVDNIVSVSVKQCPETTKNILYIDTDLPGNVILHWGICKDDTKIWELPAMPYPAETVVFKNKALRTLLQVLAFGLTNFQFLSCVVQLSLVRFHALNVSQSKCCFNFFSSVGHWILQPGFS